MKPNKRPILLLFCVFAFFTGCQKIENIVDQDKFATIKTPDIIPNSYTSIVATRKESSVEITLKYFDPEFFYKERNYTVYPDYYEVYLSKNTPDNWEMIRTIDTSYINKNFIITGLTNNELYYVYLKEITNKSEKIKNSNVAVFVPSRYKPTYCLLLKEYYGQDLYSFDINSSNNNIVYATKDYAYKPGYSAPSVLISNSTNEPQLVDINGWFPSFNSNGTKISYSSDNGEISDEKLRPEHIAIYDIKSKISTRFTSGHSVNRYPVWSPVSSLLAYSSSENGYEDFRITILNPENHTSKILQTEKILNKDIIGYSQEHPVWSADGEYIYYTRRTYSNANRNPGNFDIYRVKTDIGTPEPVFNFEGIECFPSVSPDNSKLAFLADLNGKLQIWTYDFLDNKFHQSFDTDIYDFSEIWSQIKWKDNNTILFTSHSGGNIALYSISIE